jgi:chromosome segregation ATPase
MPIDPRSGVFTDQAPNIEALGLDWPQLKELNAEAAKMGAEYRAANARLRELADNRRLAEREDADARAKAMRSGEKPPRSAVEKLDAELAELQERRETLQNALKLIESDRQRCVATHRGSWRADIETRLPDVGQRLQAAVDAAESARAELSALRGLHTWLEEPAKPYSAPDGNTVYALRARTRRQGAGPTLAELRSEAQEAASV